MAKSVSGHHWRLLCRCDDDCHWSSHVTTVACADERNELLLVLRTHADSFKHGRRIEGIAIGVNGDVTVLVLRHP